MTTRGSGQGCRFGSVIFDAVHGVTHFELPENIKDCNARMLCNHGSRAPPWKHQSDSLHTNKLEPVPITDVICVDDEAIFITGTDNDSLVSNIKQVANMVDKTMSSHTGTPARPRSPCSGLANAPELANAVSILLPPLQIPRFGCLHACRCDGYTCFTSGACEGWADFPERPFLAMNVSPMPSVFSPIASGRVNYAMSLCRCPLHPSLGLLSAHDACPDQFSSLVQCDLRAIAANLDRKPILETPSTIGLRGCRT